VVPKTALPSLDAVEKERAAMLGVDEFKFISNQEMLEAMGLLPVAS